MGRRISHDLAGPIDYIKQIIQVLTLNNIGKIDKALTKDEITDLLRQAHDNALFIKTLSSNILTYSNINVKEAIGYCITIHSKLALDNNVKFKTKFARHIPSIYTDETKFKQIVTSVLTNILDFNPPNITIEITAKTGKDKNRRLLIVIIKDNGLGFPKEFREKYDKSNPLKGIGRRADGTDLTMANYRKID